MILVIENGKGRITRLLYNKATGDYDIVTITNEEKDEK